MALALVALLSVAVGVSSGSDPQQLQIEITQCPGGHQQTASGDCTDQSQSVGQTETHSIVVPQAAPKKSAPPREVHDFSLATGKGTVSAGGTQKNETARVDLGGAKAGGEPPETPAAPAPWQTLPPVHTDGGNSPFAGFGAGFDFVSGDEALQRFTIPPFLLPIYISAGRAYGVPWNVLASINQIETDFGRLTNQVSSAGALGWMQFMPGTWQRYGVDASGDGIADPYNPVDAIYAAARYLKASGADTDLRGAVLAYNHADWYADSVLKTAGIYGALPPGLVAETGSLAYGHFPVRGAVSYGDDFRRDQEAGERPSALTIHSQPGAIAVATQNVTVEAILVDRRLADAFEQQPAAAPEQGDGESEDPATAPPVDPATAPPVDPATGPPADPPLPTVSSPLPLVQLGAAIQALTGRPVEAAAARIAAATTALPTAPAVVEGSAPSTRNDRRNARLPTGYGRTRGRGVVVIARDALGNRYRYAGLRSVPAAVRPGARLRGGQALGSLARTRSAALLFSVRAASGAPVDPRPLVDGYRLQEAADFYNATAPLGGNPFVPDPSSVGVAGSAFVAGSPSDLARRVHDDPGIDVYPCGRSDIEHGIVDKRVLGALLYLRENGLTLTVTSLRCGHGYYTASGNVSAHSYGAAVDIAAFDGQPVLGHQGPGSLTEQAIRLLMQLQGPARPAQLISLMNLGGPSFALPDHANHLHVGYTFQPALGLGRSGSALGDVQFQGGGLDSLGRQDVGKGVEARMSRKLGSIANPRILRGHGRGSIAAEDEHPADAAATQRAALRHARFTAQPTAAGARIADVDVPDGARGDEAYAIGTVERARGRTQTVLLAHRHGTWTIVGAPRDAGGHVVNPRLNRLATVHGGAGYAVGDRGAVAILRPGRSPRMIATSHTTASLRAVDAVESGGRLWGYAAGTRGAGLALSGRRAVRDRLPAGAAVASLVARPDGSVLAVGSSGGDAAVFKRTDHWSVDSHVPLPQGAAARLTSLAQDGGALWVAGGLSAAAAGIPGTVPFAARLEGGLWSTFCAPAPGLAAVTELGQHTGGVCDHPIATDPDSDGAASAIAAGTKGVFLATAGALELYGSQEFRPLPVAASPQNASQLGPGWSRLAIAQDGHGWALAANGRMARITPAGRGAVSALRPLPAGGGNPVSLALAPGGARGLLAAGSQALELAGGRWTAVRSTRVPLRAVAWAGGGGAWAIDAATGMLLRYQSGRWTVPLAGGLDPLVRRVLLRSLGARGLGAGGRSDAPGGLRALAFRSPTEGYAVGDRGAIARFAGGAWQAERSPATERLTGVAAGRGAVVAVGANGVLLTRTTKGWVRPAGAAALVRDTDLSAAGAASDGTLLVAAGGSILASTGPGEWGAAPVQPLGVRILKLSGYRTTGDLLHVVALVEQAGLRAVLDGTRAGWRPLSLGAGAAVDDFALDSATKQLWLAGRRDGKAVVAVRALSSRGRQR